VKFNFLQKQTSRREMLRGSATLAGSAVLAHLFPARLLRASAAGYAQQAPSDVLAATFLSEPQSARLRSSQICETRNLDFHVSSLFSLA
jgi:hypothetical protein